MVKYYSTQRPVMPGSFPKKTVVEKIENFNTKTYCEEIGREAWGFIEYRELLTKEEADAYELTLGGMKTFWCVTMAVYDSGKVVANITSMVEAVSKPENDSRSTARKDIYHDWQALIQSEIDQADAGLTEKECEELIGKMIFKMPDGWYAQTVL